MNRKYLHDQVHEIYFRISSLYSYTTCWTSWIEHKWERYIVHIKKLPKNVDDENISDEITFNICRQLPCTCFFFVLRRTNTVKVIWRLPSFTGEGRLQVTLDYLFQELVATMGQPTILTCIQSLLWDSNPRDEGHVVQRQGL